MDEVRSSATREAPLCSVVIPLYNNSFYTRLCLESLKRCRSTEPPHEVVVVDNGSADGTSAVLHEHASEIDQLIVNPTNLGFARASNQGARAARGRYLVFLNNDVVVEPGWLAALVSTAQADALTGAVGARLLFPDGTIQHAGVAFGPDLHPFHAFAGYPADTPVAVQLRECQAVTGACLLIDRKLFWQIGGFDESYRNSFEDADLCLKIRQAGRRIVYCPNAVGHHFESTSPGRLLRDDANLALFLERWGGFVRPDANTVSAPWPIAAGRNVTMRLELDELARRVRALAAENDRLRSLLAADAQRREHAQQVGRGSLSRRAYDVVYHPQPLSDIVAGGQAQAPVVLTNAGRKVWRAGRLALSYHWRAEGAEECLVWDGLRTAVDREVAPGDSVGVTAAVALPERAGRYVLEWDLVEDGVTWLSWEGIVPFQQSIAVREPTPLTASVEMLPTEIESGADLTVEVSLRRHRNGGSGQLGERSNLGWRWSNLVGERSVPTISARDVRVPTNGDSSLVRMAVHAPERPGLFQLEIGRCDGLGEWDPLTTLGGSSEVTPRRGLPSAGPWPEASGEQAAKPHSDATADVNAWRQRAEHLEYLVRRLEARLDEGTGLVWCYRRARRFLDAFARRHRLSVRRLVSSLFSSTSFAASSTNSSTTSSTSSSK